jgi:multicomponent Na+:H+ antiporter subunit E
VDHLRRLAVPGTLLRLLLFGGGWWIVAEGDLRSPVLAALIVLGATAASLALVPPGRPLSPIGVARLLPFFIRQSVVGGIDVLRRALDPRLPLRPRLRNLPVEVSGESARALVVSVTSLLPGSLSVDVGPRRLQVHVLDTDMPVAEVVSRLEQHAARVFGDSSRGRI